MTHAEVISMDDDDAISGIEAKLTQGWIAPQHVSSSFPSGRKPSSHVIHVMDGSRCYSEKRRAVQPTFS